MSNRHALYPTHGYAGSDSERQSVGLPGHCEDCAEVGHVTAHPDLGCGDVGCTRAHGDAEEAGMGDKPAKPWRVYGSNNLSGDYEGLDAAQDAAKELNGWNHAARIEHWENGGWHLFQNVPIPAAEAGR